MVVSNHSISFVSFSSLRSFELSTSFSPVRNCLFGCPWDSDRSFFFISTSNLISGPSLWRLFRQLFLRKVKWTDLIVDWVSEYPGLMCVNSWPLKRSYVINSHALAKLVYIKYGRHFQQRPFENSYMMEKYFQNGE